MLELEHKVLHQLLRPLDHQQVFNVLRKIFVICSDSVCIIMHCSNSYDMHAWPMINFLGALQIIVIILIHKVKPVDILTHRMKY